MNYIFGHLTLILSLHYVVKSRLLSLLFAKWCQPLPLAFALEVDILSTCCHNEDVMWHI